MSSLLAAVIAGAAGGLALLVAFTVLLRRCFLHCRTLKNKDSETGSSGNGEVRISFAVGGRPTGLKGVMQFSLEELELATNNFSESNFVGVGSFGSVYKGLLLDGSIVAVKRRQGSPKPEFVEEIRSLSSIWHRNLVTLTGYCQESGLQLLVYEYLPNGSISNHLYDDGQNSTTQLEFKQRLSVAIGAAKGLSYLHSVSPPIVHNDFKTSNVLVDENFIAKVADVGMSNLLQRIGGGFGLSQALAANIFRDPEVVQGVVSEVSDVYSFGAFLLELITGRETTHETWPVSSSQNLAQWVKSHLDSNELIDQRLAPSFTSEGMNAFISLTLHCLNPSGRERPKMAIVAKELDRILETEMNLTTCMGDGTATFTLGSQLFSS